MSDGIIILFMLILFFALFFGGIMLQGSENKAVDKIGLIMTWAPLIILLYICAAAFLKGSGIITVIRGMFFFI